MATEISVEGHIGEPKVSTTPNGNLCLRVSVASQRRKMNRNTNSWEDDGSVIWIVARFWNDEAERLGQLLHQGDKVRISGGLKREEYQKRDGGQGESLEIVNPVLWAHRSKQERTNSHTAGMTGTPDPFGTQNGSQDGSQGTWDQPSAEAPF